MQNIIMLITDTFRFDNLRHRARRPVETPYLNAFMDERAASVEHMFTGSFPTIPQRTDLATGRVGWPNYGWQPIDLSSENHIARALAHQGYATQLLCDCPHLFNARINTGFEAAYQSRGQEGDKPLLHLNDPIRNVMPAEKTRRTPLYRDHSLADAHRWINRYPETEAETFPARTGSLALTWLEENYRSGPFFLWVDFFDPHEPWDPPEYMVKKYDPDYTGVPMFHPNYGPASEYTDVELHNLWAHYAAEAELVDRWLGRILEKINDLRLWDDSVVVVTSDHGISLGEHGRTGKSNLHPEDPRFWPIYPEIGHIPFLVAAPGVRPGAVDGFFMQPADIFPTVSEMAGASIDGLSEGVDGRSFASALQGGVPPDGSDVAVSGCHVVPAEGETLAPPAKASMPFVVTEKWGYAPVGAHGTRELYDLEVDELAEHDLSANYPEIVDEMHRLFVDYLVAHRAPSRLLDLWDAAGGGEGSWAIDYA